MSGNKTRVCIVQPADPCGTVPGGIDTFIRGEINNAPDDIEYSVVGITTDNVARPVGAWMECQLPGNKFNFLPLVEHQYTDRSSLIPVTLRYLMRLRSVVSSLRADVFEFHRIEPIWYFHNQRKPMTAVLHQNMQSLYDKHTDLRWAVLPGLYFWLEDRLMPRLQSAYCVRSDASEYYRDRYANLKGSCHFQPTWADPIQFGPGSANEREDLRVRLAAELGLDNDSRWLISVGRLDAQKNPLLLISTIQKIVASGNQDVQLLMVGEGPLRDQIDKFVQKSGLTENVKLLGVKAIDEVSELLRSADLFVMSSAYEGMPMAVIEALACGVPVATTRVGEVNRVVHDGVCGRIAESHSLGDLSQAIEWCLANLAGITGPPCLDSASHYSPRVVLKPIYENYRRLSQASS